MDTDTEILITAVKQTGGRVWIHARRHGDQVSEQTPLPYLLEEYLQLFRLPARQAAALRLAAAEVLDGRREAPSARRPLRVGVPPPAQSASSGGSSASVRSSASGAWSSRSRAWLKRLTQATRNPKLAAPTASQALDD